MQNNILTQEVQKRVFQANYGENEEYSENIKNILNEDKGFYRISKLPHTIENMAMYYNYLGIESYLSINNEGIYTLGNELLDNMQSRVVPIKELSDRTKMTTLLGTKYFIADDEHKKQLPYGFKLKEKNKNVNTYENQYPLSLGIVYTEYITREEYENLSALEKEDALTKVAVVDNKDTLRRD